MGMYNVKTKMLYRKYRSVSSCKTAQCIILWFNGPIVSSLQRNLIKILMNYKFVQKKQHLKKYFNVTL